MPEKAKRRNQTVASYRQRARELEEIVQVVYKQVDLLTDHLNRLQDQQLFQHVQLTALRELMIEGRPVTLASLESRGRQILESIAQESEREGETSDAIPEAGPEPSQCAAESLVDAAPALSAG